MKTTLVGSLVTVVVSVMLMVDVPVKANDPQARERMMQPVQGHGAAMSHEELRNTMRMLWEEHVGCARARAHTDVRRRAAGRRPQAAPEEVPHVKATPGMPGEGGVS